MPFRHQHDYAMALDPLSRLCCMRLHGALLWRDFTVWTGGRSRGNKESAVIYIRGNTARPRNRNIGRGSIGRRYTPLSTPLALHAMTECPRARRPQRAGGVARPGRCGYAQPPHSSARSVSPRAIPRGRPLCCSGPQGTGRQVAPARAARLAARAARAAWRRGAARRGAAAAAGARAPRARRRWRRGSRGGAARRRP